MRSREIQAVLSAIANKYQDIPTYIKIVFNGGSSYTISNLDNFKKIANDYKIIPFFKGRV